MDLKRRGAIVGVWCGDVERSTGPRIQIKGAQAFDDFTTNSERFTWAGAAAFLESRMVPRKPMGKETTVAARRKAHL